MGEQRREAKAGSADASLRSGSQRWGRTGLPRFVDGFVRLDDVDESRRFDEDFGFLAH